MPDELKVTFQLTAREANRLEVRVAAPGGEARGEAALPDAALLDEIGAGDPARPPSVLVDQIGRGLYGALVGEDVDEVVVDTLNDAIRTGQPLQFELRFDPDQVALTRWPWEMIQNAQGQFLVRDGLVDLTRYITYPQPPVALDQSIGGLPLFRVIASPSSLKPLLAGPLGIKPVEILDHASFESFMHRLLIERLALWGLQFDGHGAVVLRCAHCDTLNDSTAEKCRNCERSLADAKQSGALAFEKDGQPEWVLTAEFGSVLYNAHVRLAMLLACETARVGNRLVFSGLAPGLLLAGVPAVIGMQYEVLDTFANSFANEFYSALTKDGDLLGALRVARRINMLGAWYSPALYLRRQPTAVEQTKQAIYLTRNIDTAAPARVKAGAAFLVRLWIRRPETKPLSAAKLREELAIPRDAPVRQRKGEAEIKFEPVAGRKLRRGQVEVTLTSTGADVIPDTMTLFIDETVDAPPAIFTVKAQRAGVIPLIFSVWQDGGVIQTITHIVEAAEEERVAAAEVAEHSESVSLDEEGARPSMVARPAPSKGARAAPPPQAVSAPPPPPTVLGPAGPPQDLPIGGTSGPELEETLDLKREEPAVGAPPAPSDLDATQVARSTPLPAALDLPGGDETRTSIPREAYEAERRMEPPQAQPPIARPVPAPAVGRPMPVPAQPKKSGLPAWLWLAIGALALCGIAVCALMILSSSVGR